MKHLTCSHTGCTGLAVVSPGLIGPAWCLAHAPRTCEDCCAAPATVAGTRCAACAEARAASYCWATCCVCGTRLARYGDEPADGLPEARDVARENALVCDRDECEAEVRAMEREADEYEDTVRYHWSHR